MNCDRFRQRIDDYQDGRLTPEATEAMAAHAGVCPDCAAHLRQQEGLRQALRDLPVPPPSGDLVARALDRAGARERRRQRLWSAGGLAVAASLLVAVAVGLVTKGPGVGPGDHPVVTVTPGKTQRINLAFNSSSRMEGVTLSVTLPEGAELAGHPGKRRLSWQTTLESGRNLLELPVIVRDAGGVLRAELEYGDTRRRLDLHLKAGQPDRSGLGLSGRV
jgi:ferric-dicitrate binding protein FerR (iron transport regulator)